MKLTPAVVENFPALRDMKPVELTPSEAGEPQPLRNDTSTELSPSRLESSLSWKENSAAVEREIEVVPGS